MTEEKIINGNRLIAEFMDFKYKEGCDDRFVVQRSIKEKMKWLVIKADALKYHSSWDWLMPVVEKIRDNNCLVSIRFNRQMNTTSTVIVCFENKWIKDLDIHDVGIKSTYKAVVEFINWYNKQK